MFAHERSLVRKYDDKPFVLLGVNADSQRETLQRTQEEEHLNWRSWWDGEDSSIARRWKVEGFPMLFLLDRKGVIRWIFGGVPDAKKLEEQIEKLLAETETGDRGSSS